MRKDEDLSQELKDSVLESLPDVNDFHGRMLKRFGVLAFPNLSGDHVGLSWICLNDTAYLIQSSIVSLRDAWLDWHWALGHYEKNTLLMAIGEARYSFDYAANLMVAASNHLSAAMWHLHEVAEEPLDRYDAMSRVMEKWNKRQDPPESLAILQALSDSVPWNILIDYRHKWVHRGIPVIKGEFRHARRPLWQDADAPLPANPMVQIKRADGQVSYPMITVAPEYEMPSLLKAGTGALKSLHQAADLFLDLFDRRLVDDGWEFKDGKLSGPLFPP